MQVWISLKKGPIIYHCKSWMKISFKRELNLCIVSSFPYRSPRVFGDKCCDKFGDEFGDSPYFVINLVTMLVTHFLSHHICHNFWWQCHHSFWWLTNILWQIWWSIWWFTLFCDQSGDNVGDTFCESPYLSQFLVKMPSLFLVTHLCCHLIWWSFCHMICH